MKSGNEQQTRLQLEEDLQREAERTGQIDAVEQKITAEEAEGKRLAAVMAATHAEIATLTADNEAVETRECDALIDRADETDLVNAATSIQSSAALVEMCIKKLRRITEKRMPAQRLRILTPKKERALLVLDRAAIRSRVHASQLLLSVIPAAEIGGDLTIKSEMGVRLAHEENQAAYDLQQATQALENEIAQQQKIRDARTNRGVIAYQNPS